MNEQANRCIDRLTERSRWEYGMKNALIELNAQTSKLQSLLDQFLERCGKYRTENWVELTDLINNTIPYKVRKIQRLWKMLEDNE